MNDTREKAETGSKVKKTYYTPELTRLGAISELTSGGAGTKQESKTDKGTMKFT